MSKAIFRIVSFGLAVAVFLIAGIGIGARMQLLHEADRTSVQSVQSTTLAVVNQDNGILYQGEEVNFASLLMETMDDDCVLVSKAMGETGLENGSYGAVLSFPSSFSQQIAQINSDSPVPAKFSYKVNPNLSQGDAFEVAVRILELERALGGRISYMYLASIFSELHTAQDRAEDVLAGDAALLQLLQSYQDKIFVAAVSHTELEVRGIDLDYPDFSSYETNGSRLIDEIYEQYKSATDKTSTDFQPGIQKLSDATGRTIEIDYEILPGYHDKSTAKNYQNYLEYLLQSTKDYDSSLDSTTRQQIDKAEETVLRSLGVSSLERMTFSPVIGFSANLGYSVDHTLVSLGESMTLGFSRHYDAEIENALLGILGASGIAAINSTTGIDLVQVLKDIGPLTDAQYVEHAMSNGATVIKILADGYVPSDEQIKSDFATIVTFSEVTLKAEAQAAFGGITLFGIQRQSRMDNDYSRVLSYLDGQERNLNLAAATHIQQYRQEVEEAGKTLGDFNFHEQFHSAESEITSLRASFSERTREWSSALDAYADRAADGLADVTDNYREQTSQLREDYAAAKEVGDSRLRDETGTLLSAHTQNRDTNQGYLSEFESKLPNSRIGSQGNTNLYSFVTEPIESEGEGYVNTVQAPTSFKKLVEFASYIPTILITLAGVYIVVVIVWLLWRWKKTPNKKPELTAQAE